MKPWMCQPNRSVFLPSHRRPFFSLLGKEDAHGIFYSFPSPTDASVEIRHCGGCPFRPVHTALLPPIRNGNPLPVLRGNKPGCVFAQHPFGAPELTDPVVRLSVRLHTQPVRLNRIPYREWRTTYKTVPMLIGRFVNEKCQGFRPFDDLPRKKHRCPTSAGADDSAGDPLCFVAHWNHPFPVPHVLSNLLFGIDSCWIVMTML